MKISLVIPAKNEKTLIGPCLEAILAQTEYPNEVIVVDNASTDGTRAVVESFLLRFQNKNISLVV
jgi:glycosyltransferase involved in cell wall biosynthesis